MVSAIALCLLLCGFITQGINGQFTVTIVSTPAGTPVSGSTNTFDFPILSSVTLTCNVTSDNGSPFTVDSYSWDTSGCFADDRGTRRCFPIGQTTETVSEDDVFAKDAGTVRCTAIINSDSFTSGPFTLRISGVSVTTSGPAHSTPATDLVSANQLADYSYITAPMQNDTFPTSTNGVALRCATGQGPTGSQRNNDLGDWYFGGAIIPVAQPCGFVFQVRQAGFRGNPGVINLYPCGPLSPDEEGVYSCMMMNSSMMVQTTRVGLYLSGRTAPMIDPPSSSTVTVAVAVGDSLTLSCTSQGSPPDTSTWMKDGTPGTLTSTLTAINHDNSNAEFQTRYTINNVTTSDSGTYTCTVTNPIGSDSFNITVVVVSGVTIVSTPTGTPVNVSTNTFDYPILSSVNLTCMVTLSNGEAFTGTTAYQWDTTGCYTNTARNSGNPSCFPTGETTQTVSENSLMANDAGTITCTVTLDGVGYTSDPLTLRISGVGLVGGIQTTGSNAIVSGNMVDDYSAINVTDTSSGILFRCVTGLGPSGNSNEELGQVSFNGTQISHGTCGGRVVQSLGADITSLVGVINVQTCTTFTVNEEGVYTCTIRNSSMVDQTMRVGVYLPVRTAPMIITTLSTVNGIIGSPVTLSCTSEGSPPDTFTWMKDGVLLTLTPSITTVTYDDTAATFRSDYTINNVTADDSGTYTCTVTNPIGSDSHSITVNGVDRRTVTIVSTPAGTPVSGSTNTFDYPILSSVTLTCMVTLSNGETYTGPYQWNTTGCYTNTAHNSGNPTCFPTGQTTQNVTGNNLLADDAGTITCTVTIDGVNFTSDPLTLRISGVGPVGGMQTTGLNDVVSGNMVDDYSAISVTDTSPGILFHCVTGLGPSGNSNQELGQVSFNGTQISYGLCDGPMVQPRGANIANFIGVINVELCSTTFTVNEEGVYTCTIRNSSMMDQTVRVGVYLPVRTAPMITTTLSTVNGIISSPLILSCTSEGSPPDTFTWMKDGVLLTSTPSITTVTHDDTAATFRSDYAINNVAADDSGTYTCTVTNPIGSDSLHITVNAIQRRCFPVTGCNETLSTSLGLMISGADTNDDCCAQSNVISMEGTSCELCPVYITRSPGGATSFPVAQLVTLSCMISGSPTGSESYSWSSSCSPDCDGDFTGTDQNVLSVTNVRARDTGSYTCTVTDGGTMMSTATISRVEGVTLHSPNFTITYDSSSVLLYQDMEIRIVCRSGSSTTSDGSWSFPDSIPVPTSGAIQANPVSGDVGTSELVISSSAASTLSGNTGVYTCTIPDVDGTMQTRNLTIYDSTALAITTIASTDPVPIGFNATLSCSATGIGPLTFNWTRQDNPSIVLSTDQVYTFTISDSSGYGSYVCGVSNSLGSDTETITVVQAKSPSPSCSDSSSSIGIIVGAVLAVLVIILLIVVITLVAVLVYLRRKRSYSVKQQSDNDITPKPRAYETVASDQKPVVMDKNPAYQSTVLANKTTDNHPPEYEIINLQPAAPNTDDVKMEKNPAYAETHFK